MWLEPGFRSLGDYSFFRSDDTLVMLGKLFYFVQMPTELFMSDMICFIIIP